MDIRNFSIIAHIDAGKSTLADRLLEKTGTIEKSGQTDRVLDSMELEREKGITIKLKPVRLELKFKTQKPKPNIIDSKGDGPDVREFILNLIDTPGHVDFSYEVSRSLAACEGVLLVIDGTRGIQAQTLSVTFQALEAGLTIIPVINKIDLNSVDQETIRNDLVNTFGFKEEEILSVSAKTGEGVEDIFLEIIRRIPSPKGEKTNPLRGLIFDSFYDEYLGAIAVTRIIDGELLRNEENLRLFQTGKGFSATDLGVFAPHRKSDAGFSPDKRKVDSLSAGEVGYVATGLKDLKEVKVGDTIVREEEFSKVVPLSGYQEVKSVVFAGFFPLEANDFSDLKKAFEKLSLNDSSLSFSEESSPALGQGLRVGFLGLLHSEIIQERIEREYQIDIFSTTPTVSYKVLLKSKKTVEVRAASDLPDVSLIEKIFEPWVEVTLFLPEKYLGGIHQLCKERRGEYVSTEYLGTGRLMRAKVVYRLPLSEMIVDFYDNLKSISSGFASLDYEFINDREVDAVRLDFLIAGERVDPLSMVVVRQNAQIIARAMVKKLKELLPKRQFRISVQAVISGKIIAREDVSALRKNVTAKLYGGDRTRKDKLLKKQKKGKERMKKFGKVEIPQDVFRKILKT